jgi:hypothetical protein
MTDEKPYNPLERRNLGKSVAEALLDSDHHSLDTVTKFFGAGIYAIYYTGDFEPYGQISEENAEEMRWPIYVGKAVPSGARRGIDMSAADDEDVLWSRIREHRNSVRLADNLNINDFRVRYLIVEDIWIPLGESLMISTFKPLWNVKLEGFGNHPPGKERVTGARPKWDTLHPGRKWALKHPARAESQEELAEQVREYLDQNLPPRSAHMKFTP